MKSRVLFFLKLCNYHYRKATFDIFIKLVEFVLVVNELKEGELEFTDDEIQKFRSSKVFRLKICNIIIISSFLLLLLFIILKFGKSIIWLYLILISCIIIFLCARYLLMQRLGSEIMGFIIRFEGNNVGQITTLYWRRNSDTEFDEVDVRFNQAVGFKLFMEETGKIELIIIVDRNYPGDLLLETWDISIVADLKNIFSIIFPEKTEWYTETTEGLWSERDLRIFETEVQYNRVPIIIRKYYPV